MDIIDIQIRSVGINELSIRDIQIPNWIRESPDIFFYTPPVTVDIGVPVINIPGCVEAHESNNPRNDKIVDDDSNGLLVFCDGGMPSFNPIQYEPENLVLTKEQEFSGVDTRDKPDTSEPLEPEIPKTEPPQSIPETADIQCPTQEQLDKEPVGFLFDSGRKEILGYKLVGDQCVREIGDVPIITQVLNGLPPTGVVITTGGIAVVATTSALLAKPFADILLKVIKPTVKKVLKKVASIRGKKPKVESVTERRAEQRLRNEAIAKLKSVKAKTKK